MKRWIMLFVVAVMVSFCFVGQAFSDGRLDIAHDWEIDDCYDEYVGNCNGQLDPGEGMVPGHRVRLLIGFNADDDMRHLDWETKFEQACDCVDWFESNGNTTYGDCNYQDEEYLPTIRDGDTVFITYWIRVEPECAGEEFEIKWNAQRYIDLETGEIERDDDDYESWDISNTMFYPPEPPSNNPPPTPILEEMPETERYGSPDLYWAGVMAPVNGYHIYRSDNGGSFNVVDTIMKGGTWNGEVKMINKKGQIFDVYLKASAIKNKKGKIIGLVGEHSDITEQKKYENILKAKEKQLQDTERLAHIGNWRFDLRSNELAWSDEIFRIFEIDQGDLAPTYESFLDVVHPDDTLMVKNAYEESLRNKTPYEIVHRILLNGGRVKYVREFCETHYENDEPIFSIGTVQDITAIKMVEEEQNKIQRLESLSVLAGGIAHDFNNLLQVIMGTASLAREEKYEDQEQLLDNIIKAGKIAVGLTNQLMVFAKGGKSPKMVAPISRVIKESAEFSLGKSTMSKCEFELPDDLWCVVMDQGQISQVIQNLVINGSHSMPGGGLIKITAKNEEKENDPFVHISVADTGIGIPEKYLKRIFDPYFTTKSDKLGAGKGLGLAVSYSIVKNHDGDIIVESEQGRGTTFHIFLPAVKSPVIKKTEIKGKEKNISGLKILIMDDDLGVFELLPRMLESLGHQVVATVNGDEAVDEYCMAQNSEAPFDLIILDLTIPGGMGGEETLRFLRQKNPDLIAIVSSGYSDNVPAGFDAGLAKPYSMDELKGVLADLLPIINMKA